jgi:hypothetical protein
MDSNYVLGGLEPAFRVLFSTIFHGIALGNCHQGRKWRILAESKTAANCCKSTYIFCVSYIRSTFKSLIPFLGIFELGMPK